MSLDIGQHPSLPLSPNSLLHLSFILPDLFADYPFISTKVLNYLEASVQPSLLGYPLNTILFSTEKKKLAGYLCEW